MILLSFFALYVLFCYPIKKIRERRHNRKLSKAIRKGNRAFERALRRDRMLSFLEVVERIENNGNLEQIARNTKRRKR